MNKHTHTIVVANRVHYAEISTSARTEYDPASIFKIVSTPSCGNEVHLEKQFYSQRFQVTFNEQTELW